MTPIDQVTVLVVDDDRFTLFTISVQLQRLGFGAVLTADSVHQATSILASSQVPIDLLLSDLNLPDVDGLEMLRHFNQAGFRGRLVLVSGEDAQTLNLASSLARSWGLEVVGGLPKPFCPDALMEMLARHPKPSRNNAGQDAGQSAHTTVTADLVAHAIENGKIEPWFQPKIDVETGTVVGVEALARWPGSALGPIYPDVFIPIAEANGLIDALTFLIVRKSIHASTSWREHGLALPVAVNVAMASLQALDFPERLSANILDAGGAVDWIHLEVTESGLLGEMLIPLEVLLRLRLRRIGLSIDDFGTGHSNLAQLRDLPFDELKLDRSFVQGAAESDRSQAILEYTVHLAKNLKMPIVAEGVENLADWHRIRKLGCDQAQGFFVAKPMPGAMLPGWVKAWVSRRDEVLQINTSQGSGADFAKVDKDCHAPQYF